MDQAIVVFSRKGLFKNLISARDIRSREHARKLWPLVTPNTLHQLVSWVSPSFEENELRRRSHFRLMPAARTYNMKAHFEYEEAERQRAAGESAEHSQAKKVIAAELNRRLAIGLAMPWWFKDESTSDFALEGNLLLGANDVLIERTVPTVFGSTFRLDVAVLGPPIEKACMILGGVEIEFGHAFDGRKALIGKSLGFPLITIDITDMSLEQITPEWALRALSATTHSHEQGQRKTYVYLHDLLYPLYVQIPAFINEEKRHQFLVFADDETLNKLVVWLNRLSKALGFPLGAIAVALVHAKSEQSRKMLERAGQVVGADWEIFNDHQCLRITIPRSSGPSDLQAHRFHMTMTRLLLSHAVALVGYKYCNGIDNEDPDEDIWIYHQWVPADRTHTPGLSVFTSVRPF